MEKQLKIAISLNLDWPLRRYHEVYSGIQSYAGEKPNWTLIWDHFPEMILRENSTPYYDGVIGRIKHEAFDEITKLNIPVVNTWFSSDIKQLMTSVFCDYFKAGELVADHLIKRGFRNFVNIDHFDDLIAGEFYKGFSEEVQKYDCRIQRYLTSKDVGDDPRIWHKFHKDFAEWAKTWKLPLGIVSSASDLGPKITTRCLENGLKIPNDVAFASAGNDLTFCEGFSPNTTSVDMNYFKIGYEAARCLDYKIQGQSVPLGAIFVPPKGLVNRESTDAYAVTDEVVKAALRYIADNSHRNIQVCDIVEYVAVSRRSLEIKFFKSIGITLVEEINRLRVLTLKRLLIESDEKINKLSKLAGFSSPLHMRRVFEKYTKMTPGEFRKANQ